jgi:hypothetical protein
LTLLPSLAPLIFQHFQLIRGDSKSTVNHDRSINGDIHRKFHSAHKRSRVRYLKNRNLRYSIGLTLNVSVSKCSTVVVRVETNQGVEALILS